MASFAEALRASERVRRVRPLAPEGATREEITSEEGREHVLLWWHVTAEEAAAGAGHSGGHAYGEHGYVQVWRRSHLGRDNRPRGGVRPLLEGPAADAERFRIELDFLRSSLANDRLY